MLPRRFQPIKPGRDELRDAAGRTVPDVMGPNLRVLFCGINPGLYSGATGHHFARPGNRFWAALHRAGFTDERLEPWQEHELLRHGLGITNLVQRATASAEEIAPDELVAGRRKLLAKIRRHSPGCVAMLGIGAYRTAFARPGATLGKQPEPFAGAMLWLLPNPSGLNAHYQLSDLTARFGALREATSAVRPRP